MLNQYHRKGKNSINLGSIFISMIPKGFKLVFRNGFASVKILNAIPSPLFSAAVELRTLTHIFSRSALFQ